MSSKLASFAKLILVVSVITASTSVWLIQSKSAQTKTLQKSIAKERSGLDEEQALQNTLRGKLQPDAVPAHLEEMHAEVLIGLRELALENDIKLGIVGPTKAIQPQGVAISSLAEPVPGSESLKSVSYQVTGTYKYYDGLKKFVEGTKRYPISVTSVSAEANNFVIHFRTYGLSAG